MVGTEGAQTGAMGKAIVHLMTAALLAGCGETTPFAVTPRLLAEKRAIEGELLFEDQRFRLRNRRARADRGVLASASSVGAGL